MPVAALEIPEINPVRFVPVSGEIPRDQRDNLLHFDGDWFVNYIREWQIKTTYAQPWQYNDKIAVHLHSNSPFPPHLRLIDCTGKIWHTWSFPDAISVSGVQIKQGDAIVSANTYHLKLRLSEVSGLPEGIYLFHLIQTFDLDGDAEADYVRNNVSEPFSLATVHPHTSRLDYYNTYNRHDVLFTQANARFSVRLAADVQDYTPDSEDTFYEDGQRNTQLLGSTTFKTAKYVTTERIPEWLWVILNKAWACDRLSVEGKPFVKSPGAKWEVNRHPKVPKVALSHLIKLSDDATFTKQVIATAIDIFEIPAYPYVVTVLSMIDNSGTANFVSEPVLIADGTDQAAFISAINAVASEDYSGAFSVSGGKVIWTNVGNDLFMSGTAIVLSNPFTYEVTASIAQAITFENVNAVVNWGDGALSTVSGVGGVSTGTHNYSGAGTYDIQIFGTYTAIAFDDGYLTNVGGKLPAGLTSFFLVNSFTITTFDTAVWSLCQTTLQTVGIYQCANLTTLAAIAVRSFPSLTYMSMATNALSTSEVSALVSQVSISVNAFGGPSFGSLYTNNQTPPAPLDAPGAVAAGALTFGYGWTVITD